MTVMTPSTLTKPIYQQQCVISTPFGRLEISTELVDGSLMISGIDYLQKGQTLISPQNSLATLAKEQIGAYLDDPRFQFNLPLKPQGSIYQCRVWSAICEIPVGETVTYGALAKKIKSGPRAVGGACGANHYPLVIPCHRIISAHGVGGFMQNAGLGWYRDIKLWLLNHEAENFV